MRYRAGHIEMGNPVGRNGCSPVATGEYGGAMSRLHRLLVPILVPIVAIAGACGGDDDDAADATDDATTEAPSDTDAAADDDAADTGGATDDAADDDATDSETANDAEPAAGPAGATATIGGETYEATREVVCITMGGALSAQFTNDDGTVTISVDVPPLDWESDTQSDWSPPSVRVDDERDEAAYRQWESGGEVVAGMEGAPEASVTSFDVDGNRASGQGTFVDVFELMTGSAEAADGTFEVTCAT